MPVYRYSLIQYVPDPVRDERVNVGVAVTGGDETAPAAAVRSAFLPKGEMGRLKQLGGIDQFDLVLDLAEQMSGGRSREGATSPGDSAQFWDADALDRASREWANVLRITRPRSFVFDDPDLLLQRLYKQLVERPKRHVERSRDRRWVSKRVLDSFERALKARDPGINLSQHLERNRTIHGRDDSHVFALEVRNGRPKFLVDALSVEGGEESSRKTEVDALKWKVEDVVKALKGSLRVAVAAIGPDERLDPQARVFESLGAELIREAALDSWVERASAMVVSGSHE